MTRSRGYILLYVAIVLTMLLSACAPAATPAPTQAPAAKPVEPTKPPAATTAPAVPTSKYKEAPTLAEQVKAGKLPPVDQRLPANPLVVKGAQVGKYGGNWRMGMTAGTDDVSFYRILAYEPLVRWNVEWTDIVPNVAEKWDANPAATEFTIYLRKGLKWSDGTPVTADDVLFWWEDVQLNKELLAAPPSWMMAGGKPATVTKVDDTTLKFTFAGPNGLFLSNLASANARPVLNFPKNFAKQYHAKYVDKDTNVHRQGLAG
jgi:peptide/nickel transport system substrate-binding protein